MLSRRVVLALLAIVSLSLLSYSLNSSITFDSVNETSYGAEDATYTYFLNNLFLLKLMGVVAASVLGFQFGRLHFWANSGVLLALVSALLFRNFESTFLLIPIPIGIGMVYPMVYYELFASASSQKTLFARAGFLFLAENLGSFLGGAIMSLVFSFFDLGYSASDSAPTHFFTMMMFYFIPGIICSGLLVRNATLSIPRSNGKKAMDHSIPIHRGYLDHASIDIDLHSGQIKLEEGFRCILEDLLDLRWYSGVVLDHGLDGVGDIHTHRPWC